MQENNFEKQVQQKTDELRLKPSDEVWQKVAASITKKEGGRRVLVVLALLLVLTCSSVFIILQYIGDKNVNGTISKNKAPGKTPQIDEHIKDGLVAVEPKPAASRSDEEQAAIVKNLPSEKKQDIRQADANDLLLATPSVPVHKPADNNAGLVHNNGQDGPLKSKNKSRYKTGRRQGAVILGGAQMNAVDENTSLNNTNKIESPEMAVAANVNAIKEQVTDTVSVNPAGQKKQVSGEPLPLLANNKEDVTGKGATPRSQKSKWKIGAKVSAGVAVTQNSYLGIGPASDEYKSFDARLSSTGGNVNQGASPRYYPSETKPGIGVIFGMYIEKSISTRTNFSAGLNYKVYNSSWVIGTRVDSASNLSSANYFYRNGNTQNYKNRFQFLELPVAVRVKLGKQNKVPMYLNVGFSISRLLSSNALQFDTLSGTYYSGNTVFNKTIASVSGGLLFSLTPQSQNPLLIGPDISFSLNKMAQSGIFKDRHYSYFGILVQKILGKK